MSLLLSLMIRSHMYNHIMGPIPNQNIEFCTSPAEHCTNNLCMGSSSLLIVTKGWQLMCGLINVHVPNWPRDKTYISAYQVANCFDNLGPTKTAISESETNLNNCKALISFGHGQRSILLILLSLTPFTYVCEHMSWEPIHQSWWMVWNVKLW